MSLRSRGSASRPSVAPSWEETITFRTPAGRPAPSRTAARARAERGVSAEARRMAVQPAARAAATPRAGTARGKFQGVTTRQGPTGRRRVTTRAEPSGASLLVPADPGGLLGAPLQVLRREGDLVGRLGERLAHLEGDQHRQVVGAAQEVVGGAAQDAGPLAGGRARPGGLRLVGGGQGVRGVGGAGVGDRADRRARRRVLDGEGRARARGTPAPAHEQLPRAPGEGGPLPQDALDGRGGGGGEVADAVGNRGGRRPRPSCPSSPPSGVAGPDRPGPLTIGFRAGAALACRWRPFRW